MKHNVRTIKAEFPEDYSQTVSGPDRNSTVPNSRQLWLPAKNMEKIKPVNILEWSREGFKSSFSRLAVGGFKGGIDSFL